MIINTLDKYKIEKSGKDGDIYVEYKEKQFEDGKTYLNFTFGNSSSSISFEDNDIYIIREILGKIIKYKEEGLL